MSELKVIATIQTGFSQKFGIPRQSGLAKSITGKIIFEKEFRDPKYIEGLEEFDYIWLLWNFSANEENDGATVRPPKLGGQKRMGVFATRAPYRPNNIGMSSVKIEDITMDEKLGPVITVSGVDMLDGTPIYDIKPYLPYADSHPEARGGFADDVKKEMEVEIPEQIKKHLNPGMLTAIIEILCQDPRPAYDMNKKRSFKLSYDKYNIVFEQNGEKLLVKTVEKL